MQNILSTLNTILTTFLTLISTIMSILSYFYPRNTPSSPSENLPSPNPLTHSSEDKSNYNSTIQKANQLFLNRALYDVIIACSIIIVILWGIYGWNIIATPTTTYFPFLAKLNNVLYFSMVHTLKSTTWIICIFAIGLFMSNLKNIHSFYRIFHIIIYGLTTIFSLICGILLMFTDYELFMITAPTNTTTPISLLTAEIPVIPLLALLFYILTIMNLSKACIYGEHKSLYISHNFKHIVTKTSIPLIFFLLILVLCYIKN